MVNHLPQRRDLGAPKVLIELAEALRELGHGVDIAQVPARGGAFRRDFSAAPTMTTLARELIQDCAPNYDVVEYDHELLPFPRVDFDRQVLMVARSVLLVHHLETLSIPRPRTLRAAAGRLLKGTKRRTVQTSRIKHATETVREADLVNVSNHRDKNELVRRGFDAARIVVLPFGLSSARRNTFALHCRVDVPARPVVAFVGTFDYRKGALDFPQIARIVCQAVPAARLKLLGTNGLCRTSDAVLRFFPRSLRSRIFIKGHFQPDELPALLADCSVGVFPSYYEGFGFGVLEMLAAGLPVIAYDAPGPPEMLAADHLVSPGDAASMAQKTIRLLNNPDYLLAERKRAVDRSRLFDWSDIAARTAEAYRDARLKRCMV
jgi:glycosyltransferase involved in cell wall biosynthesis